VYADVDPNQKRDVVMRDIIRAVIPFAWRRKALDMRDGIGRRRVTGRARRRYRSFVRDGAEPLVSLRGTVGGGEAQPVIMCVWARPERFPSVLQQLASQDIAGGIRLLVWNNDPANDDRYLQILRSQALDGLVQVDYFSSEVNIGGAARMVLGRRLQTEGYAGPVVLIDDDQDVTPGFVRRLRERWRPGTYAGVWAWRIHGAYWDRSEAREGVPASYVGTGGSVLDVGLLGDEELLRRLDGPALMFEDILLSARAHELDYRVVGVEEEFSFDLDGRDQWHAIADDKVRLYERLGRFAKYPRG
jgi:hypothetical protein